MGRTSVTVTAYQATLDLHIVQLSGGHTGDGPN